MKGVFVYYNKEPPTIMTLAIQPDFSYIEDPHTRFMVEDMYNAVVQLELVNFFKYDSPPADTGYSFWTDPRLMLINQKCYDGHSGCSFAITCRILQDYIRNRL